MKSAYRNAISNLTLTVVVVGLAAGCATKKPVPTNYYFFPPAPDEPRIQYLMSYGAESDLGGPGKFSSFVVGEEKVYRPIWKPYGLAINQGRIYVCDTQAGNVTIADLAKRKMRILKPEGQAAMKIPISVAVDKDGTCYVTDTGRGQLLIYDQKGNLVDAVGKKDEMKPCGLALSGDKLYLTDLKNHCVRVYNKGRREVVLTIPRNDNTNEQAKLFQPTNVAVDKNGRICVSDSGGFAVKVYEANGNYVRTIGELGVTPGQFALPKGIGVDREGRIYVIDAAAPVVQIFDSEGKLLMYFGEPKSSGDAGLYLPAGLVVDYDNVGLFQKYVAPGYKLEYLILLTNQVGPHKVSVFGFLKKT
jgi:DNA-binding beta-propeller fold protein YncE